MKYAIASVLLLAALALGQSWVVEQIDSTAASGSPVELVKAADGRLWAGYQTKDSVVRVACLGDPGWSFTDVCSSAELPWTGYRPFMAASPHGELCLACYDTNVHANCLYRMVGDSWHREIQPFQDSGPVNVVAYDSSGRLYALLEPWTARFVLGHETDSGWTTSEIVQLPAYWYYTLFDVGYLTVAADGSPWFFGFSGWDDHPYKWDYETDLLHFTGDTWESVWIPRGGSGLPPIPIALVPHGDGVGNLATYQDLILCDSETITACPYFLPAAGLAYSAGVPLAAWVPSDQAAGPFFAFKTNRWHVENITGPAGKGGIDIEVDSSGQVVIVYSTPDSGLWCARAMGSDVVGVKERSKPQAPSRKPAATILSGASGVKRLASSVIFDAMGRRVVNPRSGVFFIRGEEQGTGDAGRTRKVVIQR